MNTPTKANDMLVVDLDGTLVRSDMLHETFWSASSRNWTAPLAAMAALARGKAALKRRMAELAELDAAALPYNVTVLHYVESWRARGGRTALVTASDQAVAQRVAEHLGLFDEVHGSDNGTNLRGETKAEFLAGKFGDGGFVYIGNDAADLPVWRRAGKAVVVDAPSGVAEQVDRMSRDAEHLPPSARSNGAYIRAMRPHQWLKNLLVFLPMLTAHDLSSGAFGRSVIGFVAFCLVASGVYVLNDLLDLGADRAHPRKRDRPIASGAVPIVHGTLMAPVLLLAGLALSLPAGAPFIVVVLT